MYHSARWKTFTDFIFHFIRFPEVLGGPWGEVERKKSRENRHLLINWFEDVTAFLAPKIKTPGVPAVLPMTSLCSAYFKFAYDLYLIAHNCEAIPESVIQRLKTPGQFLGAYYEVVAAGIMIRAGFTLTYENEEDGSRKHCEFIAKHTTTGDEFNVEAKIRISKSEIPNVKWQLLRAFQKPAAHRRIIFIELNTAVGASREELIAMMETLLGEIRALEHTLVMPDTGEPVPSAYLVITNNPPGSVENEHRPILMVEGFKMPDFRVENLHATLDDALDSRERHRAVVALVDSLRVHDRIPSTFDGEIPAFAFGNIQNRLLIGQEFQIETPEEGEVAAVLVSGAVDEMNKVAMCSMTTVGGRNVIMSFTLSDDEITAYQQFPETFFGVPQQVVTKATDALKVYDQNLACYRNTPKEMLLSFLAGRPDIEQLKELPQEKLASVYARDITEWMFRNSTPPPKV